MGGLLAYALNRHSPQVGFDFRYFLPRLLDVRLHQLQEGWLQVQWWTPSFGAGLPAFANPQHTQFMLAQMFLPVLGPWAAAVAQAAAFNALGAVLVFWFCRGRLGYSRAAALLAGATFGTCGFMWDHALAGHVSFNVFPLVAVIPEALHRAVPTQRGIALLALAGAVIVFGGCYSIIIIFALTCLLLAMLLPLWRPLEFPRGAVFGRLAAGAVGASMLAAAKVAAVAMFLTRFPRLADGHFKGHAGWEGASLLWQMAGRRIFLLLTRWLPYSGDELDGWLGRSDDVGYGPVAIFVLAGAAWSLHRGFLARHPKGWRLAWWIGGVAAIWLTAEFALGQGLVWPLLQPLPLLRSLHENQRFAAAFALPLALLVAPGWDSLMRGLGPTVIRGATIMAFVGTIASVECFFRNRASFWYGSYDASLVAESWSQLSRSPDERFVISSVADLPDDASFLGHASTWKPYEPVFGYGYGGAEFKIRFMPGPIELLAGQPAAWRFHDPRAFLSSATTLPFTPLSATEETALRKFLARYQPAWAIPPILQVAWSITIGTGVVLFALLLLPRHLRSPRLSHSPLPPSADLK